MNTDKQNAELKKEVKELLSQIVLKLKDVKHIAMGESSYDYRPMVGGSEYIEDDDGNKVENPNYGTDDERFLSSTKELCEMMSKQNDTSRILEKYHTSMC